MQSVIEILLALAAGVGYVRARLNGLVERVKRAEEELDEVKTKQSDCPARIRAVADQQRGGDGAEAA